MTKRYQDLLKKYSQQTISSEEMEELFEWIAQSEDIYDSESFPQLWVEAESEADVEAELMADIDSILRERIQTDLLRRRQKSRKFKIRMAGIAAGLLLLIGSGLGWMYYESTPHVVRSGYGEIVEISLPDNTVVRLNANSRITYPRRWDSQKERTVTLEGEAFFEVRKDLSTHKKFIVKTNLLDLEVLGTEFNVNTRQESAKIYLESGSVKLRTLDGLDSLLMVPGEEASVDKQGTLSKSEMKKTGKIPDWKDGSKDFRGVPLGEILTEYKDLFGTEYEISDENLLTQTFTIIFPITDKKKAEGILIDVVGQDLHLK